MSDGMFLYRIIFFFILNYEINNNKKAFLNKLYYYFYEQNIYIKMYYETRFSHKQNFSLGCGLILHTKCHFYYIYYSF